MVRSILVPLDGSKFSEWSLPPALAIARRTGAQLELVTVTVPVPPSVAGQIPDYDAAWESAASKQASSYLNALVERIARSGGVVVHATLRRGNVAPTLLKHAQDAGCDLVVMTTHGRGPLSRLWLGSVADAVVRHSSLPVMLIRPEEDQEVDLARERLFRHVLVPLDGSSYSAAALAAATAIGELAWGEYTLLEVIQPAFVLVPSFGAETAPYFNESLLNEQRAAAEKYLAGTAEQLRNRGYSVETVVRDAGSTAAAILDYAASNPIDLIAMATHGRGGLGRLLLGSVADKVVRAATAPVLLVRPRGHAAADEADAAA
jgi:nucleotide-binding universal stress UspA family protein